MITKKSLALGCGLLLGAALGLGVGASLHLGNPAAAEPVQGDLTTQAPQVDIDGNKVVYADFPKNESGQTYGSDALARSLDQVPDLVSFWFDENTLAYVPKSILYATPDERADQLEKGIRREDGSVMAYKSDGKTEVGWLDADGTPVPADQIPDPDGK